jgi:hypothetical protein
MIYKIITFLLNRIGFGGNTFLNHVSSFVENRSRLLDYHVVFLDQMRQFQTLFGGFFYMKLLNALNGCQNRLHGL